MKHFHGACVLALLVGCGYKAKGNEMVGQVKRVLDRTPILCADYVEADVSLGILRMIIHSDSRWPS